VVEWVELISVAGSSIFLVDLEGHVDGFPGRIFGAEVNGGPITIVDTNPEGVTAGTEIISTPTEVIFLTLFLQVQL